MWGGGVKNCNLQFLTPNWGAGVIRTSVRSKGGVRRAVSGPPPPSQKKIGTTYFQKRKAITHGTSWNNIFQKKQTWRNEKPNENIWKQKIKIKHFIPSYIKLKTLKNNIKLIFKLGLMELSFSWPVLLCTFVTWCLICILFIFFFSILYLTMFDMFDTMFKIVTYNYWASFCSKI